MVTVTATSPETAPDPIEFPCLMVSIKSAALVYMCGENSRVALHGLCLHSGASDYEQGEYRMDWDRSLFKRHDDPVVLKNS